jgi:cytidyltransferase-like protein
MSGKGVAILDRASIPAPEKRRDICVKNILEWARVHHNDRYISDYVQLKEVVETLRRLGFKIGLTQGVFDMLHLGHMKYLEQASDLCDVLIVGVDSDELTRRRKGPRRPVVPEGERIAQIMRTRGVGIVTMRTNGDYLEDLVELIHPDVLVTSETTKDVDDSIREKLSPYCGEVVTLAPQGEMFTSSRINNLITEGAEDLAQKVKLITERHLEEINTAMDEHLAKLRGSA